MRLGKLLATFSVAAMVVGPPNLTAQTLGTRNLTGDAWKLEVKGDAGEAREQLRKRMESAPNDPLALESFAEFLGQHRDPAARDAYEKLWKLLGRNGASAGERARVGRRLA